MQHPDPAESRCAALLEKLLGWGEPLGTAPQILGTSSAARTTAATSCGREAAPQHQSQHPSIRPCTRASIPLPPLTGWKQGAARWQWQSTGRPAAISARRVPLPGRHFGAGRRREMAAGAAAGRDPRVRCCSRRGLERLLGLCAPFLRALAAGQPGGPAEDDVLWNFEAAVRENVTINGQPWGDASASSEPCGSYIKILEDQFDELIVETSTKRKQWPKKILVHVIQSMKAEQEMLKLYQPVVTPEEIRSQPSQDAYITDLKQVTETVSEQIGEAMKSLPALIERAEGFSQALTWQPTLELCKLRQEVLAGCHAKEEDNAQSFVSPGEVTPTDTGTSKNPYTLFKRKRAADSPQRRYYPLRRRKITLSA